MNPLNNQRRTSQNEGGKAHAKDQIGKADQVHDAIFEHITKFLGQTDVAELARTSTWGAPRN